MAKEVKPEIKTAVLSSEQQIEERIKGLKEMVASVEIKNEDDLKDVAIKIKNVKEIGKFIREEMERYTIPAKEIIKNAQSKFLPFEKECDEAEIILKRKAGGYMAEVEKERARKEAIIAKQIEAGRLGEEKAVKKLEILGEEKKSVKVEGASLQFKTVKVVKIINPSLVPDEYWFLDETKIRKVALAGVIIPGVEVGEEKIISSGR